ncbi:LuxR C-terminal-related transcriptional regulator [Massilia timonae]|uniref:Bacterial regulatory s, luxR family protein n=1 Tax=Massilia timonae TaxID=47229 RepID=A0A1S2N8Z4_9BURK|nr:response regulator transcription factor [Massilia timonae]OIJ41546.1 bacterial regulatory s, luxR family protein [Massilia timonae]
MPTIPSAVHIIHTDPVMTAGLHAILAGRQEWRVSTHLSTHLSQPEARQVARVLVADYDTGLALARRPEHAGLGRPSILIVTQLDKEWEVRLAMDAGVQGYVLQSCSQGELLEAVASLVQGQRYLSESVTRSVAASLSRETLTGRETDVLQLLAEGCCNKSIARRLGIGVGTVKTHVKGVMSKLDATARTHAVVVATQRGLIRPGSGIRSAYN